MANEVLPDAAYPDLSGPYNSIQTTDLFAVYDITGQQLKKVLASSVMAGLPDPSSNYRWVSTFDYPVDGIVESQGKWWKSLQTPNIGNLPQTGSLFWTEEQKAPSGLVMYNAGVYTGSPVLILAVLDGIIQMFKLADSVAQPFLSSNFISEYRSGKWELASERGYIGLTKVAHGWALNNVLTFKAGAWNLYAPGDKPLAVVKYVDGPNGAVVALLGNRITTFAGLTPGSIYYAQPGGTIGTTPTTDAILFAISATEAVIFQAGGGGGTINLGTLFPGTFFASPIGDDGTAVPGDFSKPYTAAGAVAAASPGETVAFLPGDYNITSNIAKYGIHYESFGGGVRLWNLTAGLCMFDFDALGGVGVDNVFISPFALYLNAAGSSIIRFDASTFVDYSISFTWETAQLTVGDFFMQAPFNQRNSVFGGAIDMAMGYNGYAIQAPPALFMTGSGARMDLRINNASTTKEAIHGSFRNCSFYINYRGAAKGMTDTSNGLTNCYLNAVINHGAGALSFVSDNCDVVCSGGIIDAPRGSADLMCDSTELRLGTSGRITVAGYLTNCVVSVVSQLVADFDSDNCTFNFVSGGGLFIFNGRNIGLGLSVPGDDYFNEMCINGIVELAAGVQFRAFTTVLRVPGRLVGNVNGPVIYGDIFDILMEGNFKNVNAGVNAGIYRQVGANNKTLGLKNCTFEAGPNATYSIDAGAGGVQFKLYNKSYANKALAPGTGVGFSNIFGAYLTDIVVDPAVSITA